LPGWVELKLSSSRAKDRTHVVEVLKTLTPEQIADISHHVAGIQAKYSELLDQLIEEANDERRQEGERGKHRE
jgi:hypothetical protein